MKNKKWAITTIIIEFLTGTVFLAEGIIYITHKTASLGGMLLYVAVIVCYGQAFRTYRRLRMKV